MVSIPPIITHSEMKRFCTPYILRIFVQGHLYPAVAGMNDIEDESVVYVTNVARLAMPGKLLRIEAWHNGGTFGAHLWSVETDPRTRMAKVTTYYGRGGSHAS
jgi:hypothetical protein